MSLMDNLYLNKLTAKFNIYFMADLYFFFTTNKPPQKWGGFAIDFFLPNNGFVVLRFV